MSSGIDYEENVSGKKLTSFCVGGEVRVVAKPSEREQLRELFWYLRENGIKYAVLGRGSNIVIDDAGYCGVLVLLSNFNKISFAGKVVTAGAGATMRQVANFAMQHSLSGLEFAHGIPGSVGGGVYMNAGAYGGEISGVLRSCECYDTENDEFLHFENADCDFSYRHSVFSKNKNFVILSATFELMEGDTEKISETMESYKTLRAEKQPLEFPSAGSTFKRPKDNFAGKLIEEAGLKGYTVGGAQVSPKHAGFVVNIGGATSKDIKELVEHVKNTVSEKFGVELECEIEFLSDKSTAFSELIKREFFDEIPHRTCCRRALAYGLLFDAFTDMDKVYIDVPNADFAHYYSDVLSRQFSKDTEVAPASKSGRKYYRVSFYSEAVAHKICSLDGESAKLSEYISFKCEGCRMNFLRGIFFARATLTFAAANNHLEFRIQHKNRAKLLAEFLTACGIEPKIIARRNAVGLYYKKADRIEDILNLLQANNAFFEVMNRRIERDIRRQENRATNCEAVNIKKQVETAQKHLRAIEILREAGFLDKLDRELTESVTLRLENHSASLSELASMHQPPISKSVLNNRFTKIMNMAESVAKRKK